jgi:hypothetical protein
MLDLYTKLLFEDNEQMAENKYFKDKMLSNEELAFSDKITKIKKKLAEDRTIVITNKYVYNFKGKKYRSKIDMRNITGITIAKKGYEFVIHTCEIEYDFHYYSEKRTLILELLARIIYNISKKKIDLSLIDTDFLDHYVTQKSDKKTNKGKTKFDPNNFIDIDHYLYGNTSKQKSKTLASVTKSSKSEIIFCNPNSCEGLDLKKLKIENFRHLEVLSLSIYGDVVLAEYMPTGEIYFIRTINSSDTNEFCVNFDTLVEVNISTKEYCPFMAKVDIILKNQSVTYLITKFKGNFEGGYLISKVYDCGIFCEKVALFFGAQIALIIDFFHQKNIKFLGFSPQNFLIGPDGYIKFVDYEMDYKTVKENADKICLYNGPEEYSLIENDWYNFGVIMYEMLFGIPPSFINGVLVFQKYFTVSEKAKKFLENIVKKDVYEHYSLEELKKTELFQEINFQDILEKKINIGLRFLGDIEEIPMMANDQDKDKQDSYNILNFNSIDLDI